MSSRGRVAITGLGAITPIGNTVAEFWPNLLAGKSGVGPITQFDASNLKCRIAAEIKGYDEADHFEAKQARRIERFAQLAVVAAREAHAESGIAESGVAPEDFGCIMGAGIGGISFTEKSVRLLENHGPRKISPFLITNIIPNIAPGHVAIDLNLKGPNMSIVTACAAGTHAIGEAAEMIHRGWAKAMIAGGSESSLCEIALAGFDKMRAVCQDSNDNPEGASRPYDATRSGFVMAEGAGAVVLEDYEFAKARGANILAEIIGFGLTSDAFHVTAPAEGGEGSARALQMALNDAGLKPTDIGYINAHGTSTPLNDKMETMAIKTVFGDYAADLPISSNKSMTGHLLGAAGAVEAVATVKTLIDQTLPPTINLTQPDPECDLDYVTEGARKVTDLRYAVSNSLGFGGHNSVIILSRNGA